MSFEEALNDECIRLRQELQALQKCCDEFNSRICENCKHYIFHSKEIGNSNRNQDYYTCENEDVPDADGGWLEPPEDFGCNKFERKGK